MLAAVIKAKNKEELNRGIKKTDAADLIELRLDYIDSFDYNLIEKIKKKLKKSLLITCRKKYEGGFFDGKENYRIDALKNGIKYGADYIDIEYSSDKIDVKHLVKNKNNTKIIISYHNFKETPNNIKNIYKNIKKLNPDLIKIVTNANSVTDNFKIFELIRNANKEKKKIIAFCMGSYGQFSRILSIILGSQITYASVGKGEESAAGQPTIHELVDYYRIKKLNKNTKIIGLIGNPVEHSWSHIIHNAGLDKLGINAVYLKFQVDRLKEFIEYFKRMNTLGFSVTIPHKIEVIRYLDEIDEKAKGIGAVNTIVVKNKKTIGYNTDCDGAILALKTKTNLKNKNVVVIGAGGSTRALTYGLKEEGAKISILNRTIKKAKLIADHFDCDYAPLEQLKNINYDVLINTTSVGMYPDINSSPLQSDFIKKNSVVFDIVFNPYKTKLLKDAEERGCTTIPGFEMLINGAVLQFKLWTNKNAPEQLMKKKVLEYLKNVGHQN
ncbi:MAG: shikimate dehydrogenase [Nanoarchaeota archaeon]|nr:shikimate dehydrogenase [Nanoarchaeota archaeon]